MCTVSFVNSNQKIIITSNRDEQIVRPSIEPKNYLINDKNIFFPKDTKAGGTWYAIDEEANILVLLNGASEKHEWNPPYRKSRGQIVIDIISSKSPIDAWIDINLKDIEPFTLVLFQNKKLYQLRWNGNEKETVELDVEQNYVWSSSTLYSEEIRAQRAQWFHTFLDTTRCAAELSAAKPEVSEEEMFHFHRYAEAENSNHGLVINRNESLKTLSITQSIIEKNRIQLLHHDLMEQKDFSNTFLYV